MELRDYRVYKVMNKKTKQYVIASTSKSKEEFIAKQLRVDNNTIGYYDKNITADKLSVRVIKTFKNVERKVVVAWCKAYREKYMDDKLLLNKPYIPKKKVAEKKTKAVKKTKKTVKK